MENEILALPMECWAWIPGFEGLYQVSTRGRVRSVDRWVTDANGKKYFRKGRILKTRRNKWGYLYVGLWCNGKKCHFRVNRLVAMAWLNNPMGKPEVNHLDENKDNNEVYNLSWCSRKENMAWGTAIKRMADSRLNGIGSKTVQAIDPKSGEVAFEFPSTREAGRKGFDRTCISACCLGKRKIHKGYMWRYEE